MRLTVPGETVTDATGTSVTVMADVPAFPPDVAVIVAVPAVAAVTSPPEETVATLELLVAQVTVRPVRVLPLESLSIELSWLVEPVARLTVAGETVTDATGTNATVIVDVPVVPPDVAVIVAVPGAAAVTSPPEETVATLELFVAQVTVRPVSTFPLASLSVTASWLVWPTPRARLAGATVTVATGARLTVTAALPV